VVNAGFHPAVGAPRRRRGTDVESVTSADGTRIALERAGDGQDHGVLHHPDVLHPALSGFLAGR
jgi:hypothetical protein